MKGAFGPGNLAVLEDATGLKSCPSEPQKPWCSQDWIQLARFAQWHHVGGGAVGVVGLDTKFIGVQDCWGPPVAASTASHPSFAKAGRPRLNGEAQRRSFRRTLPGKKACSSIMQADNTGIMRAQKVGKQFMETFAECQKPLEVRDHFLMFMKEKAKCRKVSSF